MPDLSECLSWKGRGVWLRPAQGAPLLKGRVVHAFPAPFDANSIDVAVRLDSMAFTVVAADQRGTDWDFTPAPKESQDPVMDPGNRGRPDRE